jgi:hypothetical protein
MNKKLLLFMIPILMVSTNVFATDVKKEDTIIKSIVINKTDENNFLNLLDDTIEIDSIKYNLQNKERLELETTNSKTEEQTKTLELSTNKKDKILDSFEESIKYDDGEFSGDLYRQDNSLKITPIKHGKYEKVFTIDKQYTNLNKADLDYIPKEITEDGYTYSLTKCEWNIAENENIQNISMPKSYTATTTYKTVKTLEYPYTYKCELTYNGEISKVSKDTVQYTLTYKQQPKEEITENKTSILPYLGGTGVFLVVIFFLLPNAKITNYYDGKYKTIKYIRVSTKNPKVNLKHLPNAKTNVFSIKFSDKLDKKLTGKAITIITPKTTYQKMIMNKSIEVHL